MLLLASLAPFVLLATDAAANPVVARGSFTGISLPMTKRVNANTTTFNVIQRDQARLAKFASQSDDSTSAATTPNVPLSDYANSYLISIGIGNPPTLCESCPFLSGRLLYAHFRRTHR
jgi:hypothetical protein